MTAVDRQDFACDLVERNHPVDAAMGNRFLRHAEDDGGRFVLRKREGAGLVHLQHAARTIVAHARHDDARGVAAGRAGGRAEQHIHRRAVSRDERPGSHGDMVARALPLQHHVLVARRDQNMAA